MNEIKNVDLIIGCNVLNHMDDPNEIFRVASNSLKTNGLVIIEVPCGDELLRNCYFDTIYHEHVNYFNKLSLAMLGIKWGFKLEKVNLVNYMGGSLRAVFRKENNIKLKDIDAVFKYKLLNDKDINDFRMRVFAFKDKLTKELHRINASGMAKIYCLEQLQKAIHY